MQRCQNAKILMESNGAGTNQDGWGMSIATQRAKERQNRTLGAKVMAETVSVSGLIREVRAPGVWGCGHPGGQGQTARGCGCPGLGVRAPRGVSGDARGGEGVRVPGV